MRTQFVLLSLVAVCIALNSAVLAKDRLVPSQYPTIQAAIDDCNNGDVVIVEPNNYTGDGNRDIDFKGKAITVQSINSNDPNVVAATVINCQGSGLNPHRGFYFHSGEDGNSVLDGFTIKNGFTMTSNYGGGGICCIESSPIVSNCVISDNDTGVYSYPYPLNGGGIYLKDSMSTIVNCIISNNKTHYGFMDPDFTGVDGGYGGGIYCEDSSPRIINCAISNNITGDGAVGGYDCDPYGCYFFNGGNGGHGGGIYIRGSAGYDAVIAHCTITGNTTGLGGGVLGGDATPGVQGRGGGIFVSGQEPDIIDSIFWNNSLGQIYGNASVSYCDVESGYVGTGNINLNPLFVTGPFGDYYLSQIAAGQAIDSPCVDAGSDSAINLGMDILTTRTDELWDKDTVDMGYHYSISPGSPDIDENLQVDWFDYTILAGDWLNCNEESVLPGDITRDTCVNGKDLKILVERWLWGK